MSNITNTMFSSNMFVQKEVCCSVQEAPPASVSFGANRWDTAEFHSTEERSKFQRLMVCLVAKLCKQSCKPLSCASLRICTPKKCLMRCV